MTTCVHAKLVEGYYGHNCAACGELIYPYGCAPWDDVGDEDYDGEFWDNDECEPDEDEEWLGRCGWAQVAGICTLAGTEECDFECPFSAEMYHDG